MKLNDNWMGRISAHNRVGLLICFLRSVFPQVTPRLEELRLFRLQQESKSVEESENNPRRNVRDKRKLGSDLADEQSPAKRKKDASRKVTKAHEDMKYQVKNSPQATKVEGANQKKGKSDDNPSEQKLIVGKHRAYSDQCTAFISNIHHTVNYK